MPGCSGAPGRVELSFAAEIGTSVSTERGVQHDGFAEIVIRRGIERCIAALGKILAVQPLDLADPFVGRPADLRQGSGPGLGVVVVSLREQCVRTRTPDLRACKHVECMDAGECAVECEMSPQHVAVPVGTVLRDVAVEIGLGLVVIAEPVIEGGPGVFVHHLVRGVVGICVGGQSDEMQGLDDSEVELSSDRDGGVPGVGIVGIKFPEDVESVQRHHLLRAPSVPVPQCEPGPVGGI